MQFFDIYYDKLHNITTQDLFIILTVENYTNQFVINIKKFLNFISKCLCIFKIDGGIFHFHVFWPIGTFLDNPFKILFPHSNMGFMKYYRRMNWLCTKRRCSIRKLYSFYLDLQIAFCDSNWCLSVHNKIPKRLRCVELTTY